MSLEKSLANRAQNQCELCKSTSALALYTLPPDTSPTEQNTIYACATCREQLSDRSQTNPNHWRCLNDSMWSEVPAVQVVAWRMLTHLQEEGWPAELLEMLYLDEETLAWAKADGSGSQQIVHLDSNGNILAAGDTVTLIQDLKVKGANFTAKRGTAVRRITLVHDNAEHIEGKIDGQRIVILTKYVKKAR